MKTDGPRPITSAGGARLTLGTRLATAVIGFVATIAIARMLSPTAFGIAAMAYVVTGSLSTFRDVGLSQAMLRKAEISHDEQTTAFWYGATATVALALIVLAIAPAASAYYGEPMVRDVIIGFTPAFLIGGLGLQHAGLMRRRLQFRSISVISASAAMAGLIAGITVAWIRRDVWALVAAATAQALVATTMTAIAAKWRPGRPRIRRSDGEILSYGLGNLSFSFMNSLSASLPAIVAGPLSGAAALGHLNRAQTLFMLPVSNLVQPVVQGAIPEILMHRNDADRHKAAYLQFVERLACVLFPLAIIQAAISPHLTVMLLGSQWSMAGTILAVLSPALAAYAVSQPASDLLATQDRPRDMRLMGVADMALRGLGIACGAGFGIVGIAAGYALGTLAAAVARMTILARSGDIAFSDQMSVLGAGFQTMIGAMLGLVVAKYAIDEIGLSSAPSAAILLVSGTIAAFLWGMRSARSRRVVEQVLSNVPGMPEAG